MKLWLRRESKKEGNGGETHEDDMNEMEKEDDKIKEELAELDKTERAKPKARGKAKAKAKVRVLKRKRTKGPENEAAGGEVKDKPVDEKKVEDVKDNVEPKNEVPAAPQEKPEASKAEKAKAKLLFSSSECLGSRLGRMADRTAHISISSKTHYRQDNRTKFIGQVKELALKGDNMFTLPEEHTLANKMRGRQTSAPASPCPGLGPFRLPVTSNRLRSRMQCRLHVRAALSFLFDFAAPYSMSFAARLTGGFYIKNLRANVVEQVNKVFEKEFQASSS